MINVCGEFKASRTTRGPRHFELMLNKSDYTRWVHVVKRKVSRGVEWIYTADGFTYMTVRFDGPSH